MIATSNDGVNEDPNASGNTTATYTFEYGANGQVAYMTDHDLKRTQWTEYDQAGRPMQATTWDGVFDTSNQADRGELLYRASIKYDKYNRLALFGERVPGKDQPVRKKDKDGKYKKDKDGKFIYGPADDDGTDNITTRYKYDRDDRITTMLFDEKDEERSVTYKYDGLGRIKTKIVRNGGLEEPFDDDEVAEDDAEYQGELNAISYEYLPGKEANATTPLISKITHSAVNTELNYEYDDVGNITKETADLGGNMNQYEYDKLGQLIRANVRNDNTIRKSGAEGTENAQGTTWVYEYDLGGNILKKKAYIRTTGEVIGEPVKTILYEYNNSNWADQMTAYGEAVIVDDGTGNGGTIVTTDMKPVTYDAIGNPLEYDGWNYTWRAGRRLMKMENQSENKVLEFKYNPSGLRTQKKVTENGITTTTDYFLHGKLLTHMTVAKGSGSSADKEAVHFYYDAQSKPIMMRVGIEEETAKYYTFVTNLQGDILGLLDRNQDLVVEYRYDPWGKFVDTICEAEHESLAKLNPFRYRGYVYDAETALYYLRTRYYNSEWARFINEDSIISKTGTLLSHNVFAYCKNSPIVFSDPSGHAEKRAWHAGVVEWVANLVPSISNKLNSRTYGEDEKTLALNHPLAASTANAYSEVAVRATDRIFGSGATNMDGTLANAFKHAYWNALMTYGIGSSLAERFANAHEASFMSQLDDEYLGTTIGTHSEMDYYYNALGRGIGNQRFPNNMATNHLIAKAVLSAVVADTSNVLIWDCGFTVVDDLGLGH